MNTKVTETIQYIGVDDTDLDLFESQYIVPNGISYNSYLIEDEKIAIMDTVDVLFTNQWLNNIEKVLGERKPDYLIVQHMEPDHSANIFNLLSAHCNKSFLLILNFEMLLRLGWNIVMLTFCIS